MERTRRLAPMAAAIILTSVLSAAGAGYASHQFSDVGDGTFFHDAVGEIFDAGCASGYNDGTFRTNSPTTRGQFAYWTANCGSRVFEASTDQITPIDSEPNPMIAVDVEVEGATGGATQFVRVDAVMTIGCNQDVAASTNGDLSIGLAGGPTVQNGECRFEFGITDGAPDSSPALVHSHVVRNLGNLAANGAAAAPASVQLTGLVAAPSEATATVSASQVFELSPGTETIYLTGRALTNSTSAQLEGRSITAQVAPFGEQQPYSPGEL